MKSNSPFLRHKANSSAAINNCRFMSAQSKIGLKTKKQFRQSMNALTSDTTVRRYIPLDIANEIASYLPIEELQNFGALNRTCRRVAINFLYKPHAAQVKEFLDVIACQISSEDRPEICDKLRDLFQQYTHDMTPSFLPVCKEKVRISHLLGGLYDIFVEIMDTPSYEAICSSSKADVNQLPYCRRIRNTDFTLYRQLCDNLYQLAAESKETSITAPAAAWLRAYVENADENSLVGIYEPAMHVLHKFKDLIPEKLRAWFSYVAIHDFTQKSRFSSAERSQIICDLIHKHELPQLPQEPYLIGGNNACIAMDLLYEMLPIPNNWADAQAWFMSIENPIRRTKCLLRSALQCSAELSPEDWQLVFQTYIATHTHHSNDIYALKSLLRNSYSLLLRMRTHSLELSETFLEGCLAPLDASSALYFHFVYKLARLSGPEEDKQPILKELLELYKDLDDRVVQTLILYAGMDWPISHERDLILFLNVLVGTDMLCPDVTNSFSCMLAEETLYTLESKILAIGVDSISSETSAAIRAHTTKMIEDLLGIGCSLAPLKYNFCSDSIAR